MGDERLPGVSLVLIQSDTPVLWLNDERYVLYDNDHMCSNKVRKPTRACLQQLAKLPVDGYCL